MGTKKKTQITKPVAEKEPIKTYTCKWCGIEKPEYRNFFKCSVEHGVFICCDCIKGLYNQLCSQCEKALAILICCHYLDIRFSIEIINGLKDYQSLGDYVRLLNLRQNKNLSFADGLLTGNDISIGEDIKPKGSWRHKAELSKIIDDLIKVKNEL